MVDRSFLKQFDELETSYRQILAVFSDDPRPIKQSGSSLKQSIIKNLDHNTSRTRTTTNPLNPPTQRIIYAQPQQELTLFPQVQSEKEKEEDNESHIFAEVENTFDNMDCMPPKNIMCSFIIKTPQEAVTLEITEDSTFQQLFQNVLSVYEDRGLLITPFKMEKIGQLIEKKLEELLRDETNRRIQPRKSIRKSTVQNKPKPISDPCPNNSHLNSKRFGNLNIQKTPNKVITPTPSALPGKSRSPTPTKSALQGANKQNNTGNAQGWQEVIVMKQDRKMKLRYNYRQIGQIINNFCITYKLTDREQKFIVKSLGKGDKLISLQ